jgi:putative hydrolase of the HAD superfamily
MSKLLNLENIDNIIFDLGMVIINLNQDATEKAFREIYGENYEQIIDELEGEDFFKKYETGHISTPQFLNQLQGKVKKQAPLELLSDAWNAMLLDIPDERFEILKWAKENFRTFCLSNTNELHIQFIYEKLKRERQMENLDRFFEKVYLSHEVGMRKPEVKIFEFVIKDNQLYPERTLFIDDTAGHLEGAKKAGLHTYHLEEGTVLEDLFEIGLTI